MGKMTSNEGETKVIRISHYEYIHVLNLNTNVTKPVVGPRTYVCLQDERVVLGPEKMISIPPMNYCIVKHPVMKLDSGEPALDHCGQTKLKVGEVEYRFSQEPFILYPGEVIDGKVEELPVVAANEALRLRALMNFTDDGIERIAGEEWLFEGPGTYYPRKEVKFLKVERAQSILPNTALLIRALRDCTDRSGQKRVYGEEWLVRKSGFYLPGPYEEVIEVRKAHIVTDTVGLEIRALRAHTDVFGNARKSGERWLVTGEHTDSYICSVDEEMVEEVEAQVLGAHKYCVIVNPVDEKGCPQLGRKKLVVGEATFFLHPGEELLDGVEDAYILQHSEGLILRTEERFEDEVEIFEEGEDNASAPRKRKVLRQAGDRWLLRGPCEYIPPVHVQVISRRELIPLDQNEGIYVRNERTGVVRSVIGQAYMLMEDEELWEKKLPPGVMKLLSENKDPLSDRGAYAKGRGGSSTQSPEELDLTRVITLRVPHNAAVQVYDYKNKRARVEFGPTLVMLAPDEQFTRLNLSGGKPKRPNTIQSLCLLLGPDFCTDIVVVETADHARLSLQLSYNWHFDVKTSCTSEEAAKLFSVPDFIGDVCKAIASRVRGTVASVRFDDFHRNSARIIRSSVFGLDEQDKVKNSFSNPHNMLCITGIDVQSVEPVDQRTRDSLMKSVQLAIEITTSSQEAAARHEAERIEQEARGRLERQKILDEAAAEESRRTLTELQVELAALESSGQATAEAKSRAQAARIECESAVDQAKLKAAALQIETDAELERLKKAREAELEYLTSKDQLLVRKKTEEMKIEVSRFTTMISSLGADTLKAIATAGSDHNLQMLNALGLQSTLITDGTTPVNLLSTAHGLIGQLAAAGSGEAMGPRARRVLHARRGGAHAGASKDQYKTTGDAMEEVEEEDDQSSVMS